MSETKSKMTPGPWHSVNQWVYSGTKEEIAECFLVQDGSAVHHASAIAALPELIEENATLTKRIAERADEWDALVEALDSAVEHNSMQSVRAILDRIDR